MPTGDSYQVKLSQECRPSILNQESCTSGIFVRGHQGTKRVSRFLRRKPVFSVFKEMCAATSLQLNPHHRAHSNKNTADNNLRDNRASNVGLHLGDFKDVLS